MYKYDLSIIVPVYNAEETIAKCINSIFNQSYIFSKIQLILVDNNSTDGSRDICLGYACEYENVEFYGEKRQGVSFARNMGLDMAQGKYIMFIDSDDFIGKHTVKNVIAFFEKHENDVDLVTYHETKCINGKKVREHVRYSILKKTGVYELEENFYALQVRINICIKNGLGVKFDTAMNFQEDQKFCTEILDVKRRLGYVKEAEYYYEATSTGLVAEYCGPIEYFESTLQFFEGLFKEKPVSKYHQALFLHDCIWKFKLNRLWPYHYSDNELCKAKTRVMELLACVEDDVIMSYPEIDNYEKFYWLELKNKNDITHYTEKNGIALIKNGKILYRRKKMEIILRRIQVLNGNFKIRGFFKSIAFNFTQKPNGNVIINGRKQPLKLNDCAAGYYKVKEKTNVFWGFEVKGEILPSTVVSFEICVDGIVQNTEFYNMPGVEFNESNKWYLVNDVLVEQKQNEIIFKKLQEAELGKRKKTVLDAESDTELKKYTTRRLENCTEEVWLYTDAPSVLIDNAYLQFKHDVQINDGIERYYIVTNAEGKFDYSKEVDANRLIIHGSEKHIGKFFKAKKILTSFIDEDVLWPVKDAKTRKKLRGGFNAEIVYLQHGILHAHLPWYYSKFRTDVDKFVISTKYEKENLLKNYDYEDDDLLMTGMARYDFINTCENSKNILLYAPSWRSYLVNKIEESDIKREADVVLLEKSNYFTGIVNLLTDEKLKNFLEESDMYLELKLHPEFCELYHDNLTSIEGERIRLAEDIVDINQYKMLITDFSSILYDFVYMNKPILYFVPDYKEFLSGLNHYRELDIPLENGFGRFTDQKGKLIDYLIQMQGRNFQIEEIYREKYQKLFNNLVSTREKLYENLK